ncbi:DUF4238 domain-containing protein [Massilia sp. TWR1-2-2]|uniref:DUF4238 domain-containing protein n=1 Tax=Massilia sp. TWR1-2-2 TaxID=2804584 RepID=UPI003CEFB73C
MTSNRPLARKHHYVPQCYLAGFTDNGRKDGWLNARRLDGVAAFPSRPQGVGAERDFNRVDIDGHRLDALETALSKFENELAPILAAVAKSRTFPAADDLNLILNLASLLHARHPEVRKRIKSANTDLAMNIMRTVTNNTARWEHEMKAAQDAGYMDPAEQLCYEDAKDFIDRGEFTVEADPTRQHVFEFDAQDAALKKLGKMSWSLFVSGEFDFISTDRPVTIRSRGRHAAAAPAGLADADAEVLFPLHRKPYFSVSMIIQHRSWSSFRSRLSPRSIRAY